MQHRLQPRLRARSLRALPQMLSSLAASLDKRMTRALARSSSFPSLPPLSLSLAPSCPFSLGRQEGHQGRLCLPQTHVRGARQVPGFLRHLSGGGYQQVMLPKAPGLAARVSSSLLRSCLLVHALLSFVCPFPCSFCYSTCAHHSRRTVLCQMSGWGAACCRLRGQQQMASTPACSCACGSCGLSHCGFAALASAATQPVSSSTSGTCGQCCTCGRTCTILGFLQPWYQSSSTYRSKWSC